MTHAPRIPQEQVSFADKGARTVEHQANADVTPGAQGRFGDLKQNLTNQWKVRESTAIRPD